MIVGGYAVIPILLRPFVGRWSDAGRRIRLMRIGLLSFAVSFALMIFTESIWVFFALRCVQGIGMAAYPTAAGSFIAEIVPPRRRGEGLGFFGLATSGSQMITPLVGGLVVAHFGGFDAVLVLGVATAGLALALTVLQREPTHSGHPAPPMSLRALVPPAAVFPMLVFLSITLTFSAAATFLPAFEDADPNRDLGGVTGLGLFFVFGGAAAMITRPIAGRISDRLGRVPVIIPGLIATIAGLVVLTQAQVPEMLWIAGALTGVGMGGAHTGLLALAVDRVAPTQRGGATATFQLAWDIGGFVGGGPVLGLVGGVLSVEMVFWAAAVAAVVALGALLVGRAMGWTRPHASFVDAST